MTCGCLVIRHPVCGPKRRHNCRWSDDTLSRGPRRLNALGPEGTNELGEGQGLGHGGPFAVGADART